MRSGRWSVVRPFQRMIDGHIAGTVDQTSVIRRIGLPKDIRRFFAFFPLRPTILKPDLGAGRLDATFSVSFLFDFYLDTRLGQTYSHGQFFAHEYIGIVRFAERTFQFVQLRRCKTRSMSFRFDHGERRRGRSTGRFRIGFIVRRRTESIGIGRFLFVVFLLADRTG